jgi:peptide/nickel transport system substrate-binding protein
VNHYSNPAVIAEIQKQASETDPAKRKAEIEDIQKLVGQDLPILPILQGSQVAVTGTDISGTTLDGAFKFRFGTLTKG